MHSGLTFLTILGLIFAVSAGQAAQAQTHTFELNSGRVAMSPPDSLWTSDLDTSKAPIIARFTSMDSVAEITLQVQMLPGLTMATLMPMIESSVLDREGGAVKLSGRTTELDGLEAHELVFRLGMGDQSKVLKALLVKPGDEIITVSCSATHGMFGEYEEAFARAVSSFAFERAEAGEE